MNKLKNLIEIKTRILIHDERNEEDDEATKHLKELGIYQESESSSEEFIEKDVTYMFDPTLGIHEIRETYIPYRKDYAKVVVVTFSEGFIQTPPLFIELDELILKIEDKL